VDIPTR